MTVDGGVMRVHRRRIKGGQLGAIVDKSRSDKANGGRRGERKHDARAGDLQVEQQMGGAARELLGGGGDQMHDGAKCSQCPANSALTAARQRLRHERDNSRRLRHDAGAGGG